MEKKENIEDDEEIKFEFIDMIDINPIVSRRMTDYTPRKKEQINRNYDFLFSEKESNRIHKLVLKYYSQMTTKGQGIKSFATYLRLKFIEKVKQFYILEESIGDSISFLTCDISSEMHEKTLEHLRKNPLVNEVKENNGIIRIETTFGEIKFSEITNFFPSLEIDDDIKKLENRIGDIEDTSDCHRKSREYSKKLKAIGIDNDVVTANRCITADKIVHLHSWNEFQIDGKEHILDYTQNLVMNKEGYYSLNHIQKIISRINCVDIENDEKIFYQIDNGDWYIDNKTYLTCRDEIMRDLQKNIDIFHDER